MPDFDFAALERRISALEANRGASLRFGTVTGVDENDGSARVCLEDGGQMVSMPLRVLHPRVSQDKHQDLPDIGEPVATLFSGQGLEQGVVLGAFYSKRIGAPGQAPHQVYTRYKDGTEVWYDREAHRLVLNVMGDMEIRARGNISIACGGTLSMDAAEIAMQEGCEKGGDHA